MRGNIHTGGEVYAKSFETYYIEGGAGRATGAALQETLVTSSVDSWGNANYLSVEANTMNATFQMTSEGGFVINREDGGTNSLDPSGISFTDEGGFVQGLWRSTTGDFQTQGDFYAGGTKNAVVPTNGSGQRKLYADESSEVYFFDRGQGQLNRGEVTVKLDPLFLETVTINHDHPMLVQITPTADCYGIFIAGKTATSFTVKELMGGTSAATFDWEVAAKRKGYEDERLGLFTPEAQRR